MSLQNRYKSSLYLHFQMLKVCSLNANEKGMLILCVTLLCQHIHTCLRPKIYPLKSASGWNISNGLSHGFPYHNKMC